MLILTQSMEKKTLEVNKMVLLSGKHLMVGKRILLLWGTLPNTFCKISGIVARAQERWDAETLAPTINHCLDSFGEERVIFGGDWPVSLLGAQLNQWVAAYREVLSKQSEIFQKKAMYSNAIQLYQLHGS